MAKRGIPRDIEDEDDEEDDDQWEQLAEATKSIRATGRDLREATAELTRAMRELSHGRGESSQERTAPPPPKESDSRESPRDPKTMTATEDQNGRGATETDPTPASPPELVVLGEPEPVTAVDHSELRRGQSPRKQTPAASKAKPRRRLFSKLSK